MIVLEVFYIALATIAIMALLQLITFVVMKILYPPEPKIIYRDAPIQYVQAPPQHVTQPPPVFTQPAQEIQLPDYEPRKPVSTSLRMDAELPDGLQETRPPGT